MSISRKNLIPNPSFEIDDWGWDAYGGTGSESYGVTTAQAAVGTKSLFWTCGVDPTKTLYITPPSHKGDLTSLPYTFQCRVLSTVARTITISSMWNLWSADRKSSTLVKVNPDTTGTTSTTAWTTFAVVASPPPPLGPMYMDITITISGGANFASGETHYLDAVMLEQSDTVGDYFDGDST